MELYKAHRPTTIKGLIGQPDVCRMLLDWCKRNDIPHTILLTGPSGCGKTTIARILKTKLECSDRDFTEINAAKERGIDMVRQISQRMGLAPILGKSRIFLIDEAHRMTGEAQDSILKIAEDTPKHVWIMFATTEPAKIKRTIITRCAEIKVKLLGVEAMAELLVSVCGKEKIELHEDVRDKLIEYAEGSARKALQLLQQIRGLAETDAQLRAINASLAETEAIELARVLMGRSPSWPAVAKVLKSLHDEDPESIRYMVINYANTILLSGGPLSEKAFLIIDIFRETIRDSGRAGLTACCWEFVKALKR